MTNLMEKLVTGAQEGIQIVIMENVRVSLLDPSKHLLAIPGGDCR